MTVAIKMIVVPTNIMIPNNVSDRATARNPPINTYTSTEKVNKNSAVVYDSPVSDSINRPPPTHWATVAENKKIIIHNAESITTALLLYLPFK
ncbi:Uncharacterised protein [Streptococcus pneumoniae]|nr:Uncharacterised protein [Streptococcus pneumoniae]